MRRLFADDNNASTKSFPDLTGRVKIKERNVKRGVMTRLCLGTVQRGRYKTERVAVKIFSGGESSPGQGFATALKRMLEESSPVWNRVDHPNLVPFYGIASGLAYMPALVYPYYYNGNIMEYLAQQYPGEVDLDNSSRFATILDLVKGAARGLEYLHTFNPTIIHADIRGASILIDDGGHARLCDYGLVLSMPGDLPEHVHAVKPAGVVRWMAPELMATEAPKEDFGPPNGYTKETDIYAFVMTIFEVYTGLPPFSQLITDEKGTHPQARNDSFAIAIILKDGRPPLSGHLQSNDILRDLIQRGWDSSPQTRPDASEVRQILENLSPEEAQNPLVEPSVAQHAEDGVNDKNTGHFTYLINCLAMNPWLRVRRTIGSGYRMLRGSFK